MGQPGATGARSSSIMAAHSTSHVIRHFISSSPPLLFFYLSFKCFVKSIVVSNLCHSDMLPFRFLISFRNFFFAVVVPFHGVAVV